MHQRSSGCCPYNRGNSYTYSGDAHQLPWIQTIRICVRMRVKGASED